jgi:hypothetical protein
MPAASGGGPQHFGPQILLRENQRALLREERVGARMVAVHVRVDQHLDRRVGERPDRLQRLFSDLSVLRVHHQDAVPSKQHQSPAAGRVGVSGIEALRTVQHEEIRRHLFRHPNLNPVPGRLITLGKRERPLARRDERGGIFRALSTRDHGAARDSHAHQQERTRVQHEETRFMAIAPAVRNSAGERCASRHRSFRRHGSPDPSSWLMDDNRQPEIAPLRATSSPA